MIPLNSSHRIWGLLVIVGGTVITAELLSHPPILDPWHVAGGLNRIAAFHTWKPLHMVLALGLAMWLMGLAGCTCLFSRSLHILRVAVSLFVGSLAKWLLILSAQIGVLPILVKRMQVHEDYTLTLLGEITFTSTLIASYAAMTLVWLATILVGSYLHETDQSIFFPRWAFWAGWLGIAGITAILVLPVNVDIVAPLTSAPSFLWSMVYGWRFACKTTTL